MPKQAIRLKDALIAGHALALGVPLITRDRGFSRFDSVTILSPEDLPGA
jgi:predicted nucleic acid-binding protein